MAENSEALCHEICRYLNSHIDLNVEYAAGIPWQERKSLFDRGSIHVLWLCGLPYVHKADRQDPHKELLAVPMPMAKRYQGRAAYFSDVLVQRDSPFLLAIICAARCGPILNRARTRDSTCVRAYLAERGEQSGFFAGVVESGAHSRSLELIVNRQADAAAIDSLLFEWLSNQHPEWSESLRVVDSIGPSPIPPWVISRQLPMTLRIEVRRLLLQMHHDRVGRHILERAALARFVGAHGKDYDPIRRMA